jgi:hypothetical protein
MVWDALCYADSERLECPECGYMVQVPPGTELRSTCESCIADNPCDPRCLGCDGEFSNYMPIPREPSAEDEIGDMGY